MEDEYEYDEEGFSLTLAVTFSALVLCGIGVVVALGYYLISLL